MIFKSFLDRFCGKKINRSGRAIVLGSLSLLLVLLFAFVGCESVADTTLDESYNNAISLMEEGKYAEAIDVFGALDGYKESEEYIKTCQTAIKEDSYKSALKLMEDERYEDAIKIFESLDGYKLSTSYIISCNSAINENEYDRALGLMEDGRYEEAIEIFEFLNGYSESNAKIVECRNYSKFIFELNSSGGSYSVNAYRGNDERIIVPSEYKGLPVTNIANQAFIRCEGIVEVVLPDSLVSIGKYAFAYCYELQSVTLPEKLETIGDFAFYGCDLLSGVTLPNGIGSLGESAFGGCIGVEKIVFVGSSEEWEEVSLGDNWNAIKDENGVLTYIPVSFEPVCNGVDHYTVIDAAVAPTCTESGLSEGSHCQACGKILVVQTVIDALGHDVTKHDAKAPACTEIGWNEYETCSRCDYTTYIEISMLGHKLTSHDAKDATCTEIGWEAYETCSRCDHSTYVEIAVLEHTLTNYDAKEATCTEIGWSAYGECSNCDYSTYAEISALGHDIENYDAKSPTCTEIGWEAYETCSRCNYTTYKEIPTIDHDIINYDAKSATCTEIGWNAYEECSGCDYTTYVELPILEHDLTYYEAQEPTCTMIGWEAYEKCSGCDYTTYVEIAKIDHDITEHEAQKATCISIGWNAYETCSGCDHNTYVEIPVDSEAHDINKENTCTLCLKYFDEGVVFVLSDDEAYYTITDYTGNAERVVIPSQYMGIDVTSIADSAFADCVTLKTIIITENITNIGENAFSGCTSLISVKYTGSEEKWADIEINDDSIESIDIIFEYDFNDVLDEVVFHFINVGQGDAILVTTPWGNMLIDSGDTKKSSRDELIDYLTSQNVTSFEYVVFTHPDADHIGSADYILLNYDVKNVIMPDYEKKTTTVYYNLLAALEETDVNLILIGEDKTVCEQVGYTFNIGSLVNTVLGPIHDDNDSNEMSVVVKSEFGETSVLFTGDAESGSEQDMLALYKNGELDCDILKVGHHGSSTSTTAAFLAAVSPDIAVISCGVGNSYGHPHKETIDKLEYEGVEYYRTDIDGDVVIKTDGVKIEVFE